MNKRGKFGGLQKLKALFKLAGVASAVASTTLFPLMGESQTTATISVTALYELRSFLPGSFIPVKLTGTNVDSQLQVLSVEAVSDNGTECKVISDPHVAFHYLAKCRSETNLTLNFRLFRADKVINLAYGPMAIKLPTAGLVVVGEDEVAAKIKKGAQAFSALLCINCHQVPSKKKGSSLAVLKASMTGIPDMNGSNTASGGADYRYLESETATLEAIEAYLGSL